MKCYTVENHPNDSRATIDPNGIVQTLNARMETGGSNTPIVLVDIGNTASNASISNWKKVATLLGKETQ